eukprot:6715504-Lingulodinium_polyedra.AAC.1
MGACRTRGDCQPPLHGEQSRLLAPPVDLSPPESGRPQRLGCSLALLGRLPPRPPGPPGRRSRLLRCWALVG